MATYSTVKIIPEDIWNTLEEIEIDVGTDLYYILNADEYRFIEVSAPVLTVED